MNARSYFYHQKYHTKFWQQKQRDNRVDDFLRNSLIQGVSLSERKYRKSIQAKIKNPEKNINKQKNLKFQQPYKEKSKKQFQTKIDIKCKSSKQSILKAQNCIKGEYHGFISRTRYIFRPKSSQSSKINFNLSKVLRQPFQNMSSSFVKQKSSSFNLKKAFRTINSRQSNY